MTPQFKNKDEYLQWRVEWRARYAALSKAIRAQKWSQAWSNRVTAKMPNDQGYWLATPEKRKEVKAQIEKEVLGDQHERWKALAWSYLPKMREEAAQMMEWRKQSKVRAQELYMAGHQPAIISGSVAA